MGIPIAAIIASQTAMRAAAMNAIRMNQKAAEGRQSEGIGFLYSLFFI